MSGLQRLFLDWSSSTLREKHLRGRMSSSGQSSSSSSSTSQHPTRQNKLAQWQTSVAKNTVAKRYTRRWQLCSYHEKGNNISSSLC